jgi:hypothetical protein
VRYDIEAIPTTYRGVRFRSQLEARWAAFFDVVGWKYKYEPFALGNWIPDFTLCDVHGDAILVEVKPIKKPYLEILNKMAKGLTRWVGPDPNREHEMLLLGSEPFDDDCLGWLVYTDADYEVAVFTGGDPIPDFCSEGQSFVGRITGYYEGGRHGSVDWEPLWRKACGKIKRLRDDD